MSIDHLKTLPASVKFITEAGHGVQDNATMAKAFAICTQKDITVMSHAEDMEISPWDYRLAEEIETVRNCWRGATPSAARRRDARGRGGGP